MAKIATLSMPDLDEFDRKILMAMQRNNQASHASIGEGVGLSASAVRRRLSVMRQRGVIHRDMTVMHPDFHGVTLIVSLSFSDESPELYEAFDAQMAQTPEVQQSFHVAGDEDYVLIVHGPNLRWYEDWSKKTFMANPAIRRYSTKVVWSCKKYDPAMQL